MGHNWSDFEEFQQEEAKQFDKDSKVISKLSEKQIAASILKSEIEELQATIRDAEKSIKIKQKRFDKLKTKVPKVSSSVKERLRHRHHRGTTVNNYVLGKGWDDDTGWM